jgi:phytanoyl-CoA hydroxylase
MSADHTRRKERYDADGFVVVTGLFTSTEVAQLRGEVERYVREVVPNLPDDAAFYDDRARPETLRKLQSLHRHDAFFAGFAHHPRVAPLVEALMGDACGQMAIEWFDKLPFDQDATPPHQDGFYWCRRPNIACGLWIALDPVDRDNACLWYARGSHRGGVLPHAPSGVLGFSQGVIGFDRDRADAVPIEIAPGDAVIHHPATVHWTLPNRTARRRRALSIFAFGASTERDDDAFARYKASLADQLARRGIVATS